MPPLDENKARSWAVFCHLSALVTYLGIPFGNIVGPLVIWLIKKNDHPMIDQQGKEALNFQLSITLYAIISAMLILVLIGIVFLIALAIFNLICIIIAAVKASNGVSYQYPLSIRFIK